VDDFKPTDDDTIVAVATAAGRGGIGIVRISGRKTSLIAERLLSGRPPPKQAVLSSIKKTNGDLIDQGIVLFFPAPNSFTGEDVLEIQAHGNPVILDEILHAVVGCGARIARPGEFSERAFLNNKIDLTQAEAIADLIAAETVDAAQAAQASLQGVFSKEVHVLVDSLVALRAYIEAALDFPEEEIDFLTTGRVEEKLRSIQQQLDKTRGAAKQGALVTEGMTLVIAGKPNAGKSSLLNALTGRDSAIVTPVPGTTRDILREHIQIDGMPLHIIDTAGLRESDDIIEQEGVRRAAKEIEKADRILLLVDSNDPNYAETSLADIWPPTLRTLKKNIPVTRVFNKCDLSGLPLKKDQDSVVISAKTEEGIDLLKEHLKEVMGYLSAESGKFSARRRHLEGLEEASKHLSLAVDILSHQNKSELLAEELRLTQRSLEILTGRFTPDDLLEKIFRDFCIGK
jgi:tRNA modification GTPase